MDAVQFLLEEHQKVKQRFAEIEQASTTQRLALWRALEPELKIHEEIEDTYLYGPVSQDPAARGSKAARFEEHQDKDVAALEQKIHQLQQLDAADDAWLDKLQEIREALMDHVREEEQTILPQIAQFWDRDKLAMAGRQMAEAKQEAMQNPHHYATVMAQRSAQASSTGGVAAAAQHAMDSVKETVREAMDRAGLDSERSKRS